MKKKIILILAVFINIYYICYPQQPQSNVKKAELVQVEYLTKELGLTTEDSEKFWPVYRNYRSEIKIIRKGNQNDQIALEEQVLNVRKKYKEDFKKILRSDERVNKLFLAEKNFKEMLRKELIKRRMNRQGN